MAASADWKQLILDHYKNPRHFGAPAQYAFACEEHNRTCGDHVHIYLTRSTDGRASLSFTGAGCSLSIATASLMCTLLEESDRALCARELENFQRVWNEGAKESDSLAWQLISELRQYPVRSRCVKLPWQALQKIKEAWDHEQLA